MRTGRTFSLSPSCGRLRGFTLVEVLAAMFFMAIVIPAAVHALTVANRLGVAAERGRAATRLAGSLLTEKVADGEWKTGGQEGEIAEDAGNFRWALQTEDWPEEPGMILVSVSVAFDVQGREFSEKLSTLVDGEQ